MEGDGKEEEEEERARAVRLRRLVQFTPGGFPPVSFALCLSQEVEEGWFRGASEPRSCHRRSFTDVNRGRVPRGVLSILCIAEQSRPTPRYTLRIRQCIRVYVCIYIYISPPPRRSPLAGAGAAEARRAGARGARTHTPGCAARPLLHPTLTLPTTHVISRSVGLQMQPAMTAAHIYIYI